MKYPSLILACCLLLGGVDGPRVGRAQDGTISKARRDAVRDGIEAIQRGERKQGAEVLQEALLDSLSYVDEKYGTGAYWLGRAYATDGTPERALPVWRAAILSLDAEGRFEARLADTFVHHVFTQEAENYYSSALDVYRRLLEEIGTDSFSPEGKKRVAKRLRHLALVLPSGVRRRAGLPTSVGAITPETLSTIDGQELIKWWRSQDPLPATSTNEQLEEHLHRVAEALTRFAHVETYHGFDDRGKIYVRFGPPDHNVSINYNQSRLTDLVTERKVGVDVDLSDFPKNEFWSYGNYDRKMYYIFVEKKRGGPFRLGRTEDLLPRSLRGPFNNNNKRGIQRSLYSLAALRAIYRKYSPFHPEFATRHDKVANYLSLAEKGGLEQFNTVNYRTPDVFATQTIMQNRNDDAIAANRREEAAPNQVSTSERNTPLLDIASRTVRFLNDDGSTRTEVYWAPKEGAMKPSDERYQQLREDGYEALDEYLIRFTVTQQAPNYENRIVNREHYRLKGVTDVEGGTIPARTFTTRRGDSTLYHLGMQWDQYLVDVERGRPGPKIKMATERKDSLRALEPDERILQMSGLKPMVIPEGENGLDAAVPYPFTAVPHDMSMILYFEAYHLALDRDDQTEYTVRYETNRRTDRGELVEVFRGEDEKQTAVSTTHKGESRTAQEYIVLDLENWEVGTEATLSVTVRVTDETSGQEVERSVDFQIVPSSSR